VWRIGPKRYHTNRLTHITHGGQQDTANHAVSGRGTRETHAQLAVVLNQAYLPGGCSTYITSDPVFGRVR
jgi:hypothetical protein